MDRILITADRFERSAYREEWAQVEAQLEANGFEVSFPPSQAVEYRGSIPGQVIAAASDVIEIVIHHVEKEATDHAVDAIVDLVIGYLLAHVKGRVRRGPLEGEPRMAKIYGGRGQVIKTVELTDDDDG